MNEIAEQQLIAYRSYYSKGSFWKKLTRLARFTGRDLLEKALCLYYAAQRPETPAWAKAAALGALGYLIAPLDVVPDIAPVLGYTDDLGVLLLAIATIASHIDDTVRYRARHALQRWFKD